MQAYMISEKLMSLIAWQMFEALDAQVKKLLENRERLKLQSGILQALIVDLRRGPVVRMDIIFLVIDNRKHLSYS